MAVVQVGSMRKAAEHLNTTQPSISRSITELEGVIGVRLLDRNRQGVKPTEYGRALLDGGAAMFDELRQAVNNIEFLADPAAGDVRIGCPSFLAASFVSAVVDRVSQRYPRIAFHLVTTPQETLNRELRERNVDLLITPRLNLYADDQFGFEVLYDNTYVVVAGAQNPWANRRRIELAELVNELWVLPPPEGSVLGAAAKEAFRTSGIDYPRATVSTVVPEARISPVSFGRFLTILTISVLRFSTERSKVKVLPVKLPMARVPIGIVTLKNRTLSPVAKLFIEHAREIAKPLAKSK